MGDHFQVEHRLANMLSQMGNNKLSMRPYCLGIVANGTHQLPNVCLPFKKINCTEILLRIIRKILQIQNQIINVHVYFIFFFLQSQSQMLLQNPPPPRMDDQCNKIETCYFMNMTSGSNCPADIIIGQRWPIRSFKCIVDSVAKNHNNKNGQMHTKSHWCEESQETTISIDFKCLC